MAESNSFFSRYRSIGIVAVIVVVALGIYFAQKDNGKTQEQDQTNTEESQNQNDQTSTNSDQDTNQSDTTDQNFESQSSGNVTATGTLEVSDNQNRGNYVLNSDKGRIYINTKRDFSGQVGHEVTLNAEGTLNSFVFLGFNQASGDNGVDTTAVGGAAESLPSGRVTFSGTLQNSNNTNLGNYTIVSGSTTVYLKTVHDYSALLGKTVELNATGTLASFTGATITQK